MAALPVLSVLSVAVQVAAALAIGGLLCWLLLAAAESRLRWRTAFASLTRRAAPVRRRARRRHP